MSQYIPDMTERFPEGMRGEDHTQDYFTDDYYFSAECFDREAEEDYDEPMCNANGDLDE